MINEKLLQEVIQKHLPKAFIGYGQQGFMCQVHYPELCKIINDYTQQQVSVEPEVKPACGKKDKTMSWKEDLENKKMFAAISTRTGITYKVLEIEDTIKFIEENFILKAGQVEPEVKINLADMKKEFDEKFSFKNIRDTMTFDVKTLRQINEKDIWQWFEEKLKAITTL